MPRFVQTCGGKHRSFHLWLLLRPWGARKSFFTPPWLSWHPPGLSVLWLRSVYRYCTVPQALMSSREQSSVSPFKGQLLVRTQIPLEQWSSAGGSCPLCGSKGPFTEENTDIYIMIRNSTKSQFWSRNNNNVMVGGHHSRRNCISRSQRQEAREPLL